MKKMLFTLAFLFLNFSIMYAQSNRELLVLDNYLIPIGKKGAIIGKVITPYKEKVTIVKDASELFEISKDGTLKLKKDKVVTSTTPKSFEIVLKYGKNKKAFELVKDEFIRNGVVAHRGAWKKQEVSQNSMKSLKKAIEIGCQASEFDVWLSSDNIVILSHDPSIGGNKVEETSAEELFKIPLKDGDSLPSLEQYINCIKQQNKTRLVLEVKSSEKGKERSEAVAEASVRMVHNMNAQAWVDYITFNFDAARRIRQLDTTARILYLEADKSLDELNASKMSGIDYHFSHFFKDTELTKNAKIHGLLTNAWTVNKEADMKTLLNQGVDYITTDEPELLLKLIAK